MKKILLLTLLLAACTGRTTEQEETNDSTATSQGYDEGMEPVDFTILEEVYNAPVIIGGKQRMTGDYLTSFYWPDHYQKRTANADSAAGPQYIITSSMLLESNFFVRNNQCSQRSVLLTSRGVLNMDEEYYDLFFLGEDASGKVVVADKVFFEGSSGQSSTTLTITKESLAVDKNCFVLGVTSSTEGGDINLHKDEWIEFYVADGRSFHAVLKLELEDTDIQDYEATQDENQDSSSQLRTYELLTSAHNGLYDIKANFTNRQNGKVISSSEEIYEYDGEFYVKK